MQSHQYLNICPVMFWNCVSVSSFPRYSTWTEHQLILLRASECISPVVKSSFVSTSADSLLHGAFWEKQQLTESEVESNIVFRYVFLKVIEDSFRGESWKSLCKKEVQEIIRILQPFFILFQFVQFFSLVYFSLKQNHVGFYALSYIV